MTVQYEFPKVAMWSVHFPQWYKKRTTTWKTNDSVPHDLLSMEEYVFVTGSEASTESITGRNENQTKWKICIQKTFLSICIKSSGLYKQVKPHWKTGVWLLQNATFDHQEMFFFALGSL